MSVSGFLGNDSFDLGSGIVLTIHLETRADNFVALLIEQQLGFHGRDISEVLPNLHANRVRVLSAYSAVKSS